MLASDPVSRLSTQMTRWPRRSSSSQRCDPRNPAPPVTRQVAMRRQATAVTGVSGRSAQRAPSGLQVALGDVDQHPARLPSRAALPALLEPLADDRAALAARPRLAAALLRLHPAVDVRCLATGHDGRFMRMPADAFVAQLNEQIANEFAAHQQYVACAVYYDDETLPQLAAFFYRQAMEERDHAMMMVQYLLDTDAPVTIPGVAAPVSAFADVVAPDRAGARPGEARHRPDQRAGRASRAPRTTTRASSSCSGSSRSRSRRSRR